MKSTTIVILACVFALALIGGANAQCPQACGFLYQPVCAKTASGEQETHPSKCNLEVEACKNPAKGLTFLKDGPC